MAYVLIPSSTVYSIIRMNGMNKSPVVVVVFYLNTVFAGPFPREPLLMDFQGRDGRRQLFMNPVCKLKSIFIYIESMDGKLNKNR